jgi:hypothetical protein
MTQNGLVLWPFLGMMILLASRTARWRQRPGNLAEETAKVPGKGFRSRSDVQAFTGLNEINLHGEV